MDKLSHMTDDQLVQLYVDGCNEAFDDLLCRHKDALYNYISFHIKDSSANADDVFQETFVKVIMCLREGRYTSSGHFFAWLSRIAHNIIMDQLRSSAQLPTLSCISEDQDLLNNQQIVETYHEQRLVNEQTLRDVKALMNHLPEPQREVIYMRYYENRSFKEIADLTGVSINTSLGRMRYGIENMRKLAQQYDISLEIL